MRIAAVVTSVILGLGTLSACGGSSYCDVVKEEADTFKGVDLSGGIDMEDSQKVVDRMTDAAPKEIKDDWKVLGTFFTGLVKALEDAGYDDKDLDKIAKDGGASLSKEEAAKLSGAFVKASQSVDEKKLNTAMESVDKYTKDECDISLTSN